MKIAMVGLRGIPAQYGGIEKHVEEISWRLGEKGDEILVYCRNYYTPAGISLYSNVRLVRLPTLKTKHFDNIVHTFLSTIDAIIKKVDIIHFHAIGPAILAFIPAFFKVKTVVTIHSLDWKRKKWGRVARSFLKIGEWVAVRFSNDLIVVSKQLKEYIKKNYKREAHYIPNGITRPIIRKANRIKQLGLEEDNYILTVARLVPEKGIHYLLEAFNGLPTGKKLAIAGDSCFSDSYVNRLKKISDDRVVFLGYQTGRFLEELYSNASLFVLPSEEEGFSISLLEALSYKRTVLVSDIPPNIEAASGFGFTFQNKNPDDLREKLKELLLTRKKEALDNERAASVIQKTFNWDVLAEQVNQIYNKLEQKK